MAMEINSSNFQTEIADFKGAVVVDFWAPWCGPCRMMTPIIESLSTKMAGKVKFAKLNVDEAPDIAAKFSITSIPTIIFFKDGKAVHQAIGVIPENELENQVTAKLL